MEFKNTKNNTFCVSLERSPQRREHFSNQCKQRDIKFSFFDAVDGNKIKDIWGNLLDNKRPYNQKTVMVYDNKIFTYLPHNVPQVNNKQLTVYQFGCARSHLLLYEQLINDDKNDAYIFFEDDFIMNDNFTLDNLYKIIKDLPKTFDLCYFSPSHAHKNMLPKKSQITENVYHVSPYPWFSGTGLYMMSKKGAKKALELNGTNIIFAADDMFSYFSGSDQMEICSSEISLGYGHDNQKFPTEMKSVD